MPKNPFEGSSDQAMKAQSRAVRAYSAELKRLLKTENKVVSANTSRNMAALKGIQEQNVGISRTSSLLGSQEKVLAGLDSARNKYHAEEMKRSDSLIQKYENVKTALKEMHADAGDTSTLLGSMFRGWKSGAENLVTRGHIPRATEELRGLNVELDQSAGFWERFGSTASQMASNLASDSSVIAEQIPLVAKYYAESQKLDVELEVLSVRYNLVDGAVQKLGDTIMETSKIDLAYGSEAVSELADSLLYLSKKAMLSVGDGAQYAADRVQETGMSLQEAGVQAIQFSQMADLISSKMDEAGRAGEVFSFGLRSDFVAAMMEAHRQFNTQTTDLQNVAAAYAFAALEAGNYGLSSKASAQAAEGIGQALFSGGLNATSMLSGDILASGFSKELAQFRSESEENDVAFGAMNEAQISEIQNRIQTNVLKESLDKMTRVQRTAISQGIRTLGQGLSPSFLANTFNSTRGGIDATLQTHQGMFSNIDSTATSAILKGMGIGEGDESTRLMLAETLANGDLAAATTTMQEMVEESRENAEGPVMDLEQASLTAVLTLQDPINQLFNIKDLLKAILININTVSNLVSNILGVGGLMGPLNDIVREMLTAQNQGELDNSSANYSSLITAGAAIAASISEKREELGAEGLDGGDRVRLQSELTALQKNMSRNEEETSKVKARTLSLLSERSRLMASAPIENRVNRHGVHFNADTSIARQREIEETQEEKRRKERAANESRSGGVRALFDIFGVSHEAAASAGNNLGGSRSSTSSSTSSPSATGPLAQAGDATAEGRGEITIEGGQPFLNVKLSLGNMDEAVAQSIVNNKRHA